MATINTIFTRGHLITWKFYSVTYTHTNPINKVRILDDSHSKTDKWKFRDNSEEVMLLLWCHGSVDTVRTPRYYWTNWTEVNCEPQNSYERMERDARVPSRLSLMFVFCFDVQLVQIHKKSFCMINCILSHITYI